MNPIEYLVWKMHDLFCCHDIPLEEIDGECVLLTYDELIDFALSLVHNANAVLKSANGEKHEELADMDPARKESIRNAIKYALENDTSPEESHISWLEAQEKLGYVYGPVIDRVALQHPCMVPYNQLPEAQKTKDAMFVSIINTTKGILHQSS